MKFDKVRQFIEKHQLLKKGSTVVVGVSGGPDSIALLHYLWTFKDKWELSLIAAHVDHMFRGKQSYEDLLFVKDFCEKLQITFEGTSIDVPEYIKIHQLTPQVAARECRYQFYSRVLEKYSAQYLALAHHGDDQVETMLMRMVRGSYGKGLAGIPVKRDFHGAEIIRPFLCLTRDEIEQYIDEFHLSYRVDPSNEKDDYQRNRFRHYVLPFLKSENPNVAERFQTISELLMEDEKLLEEYAAQGIEKAVIEKTEKKVVFLINEFKSLPISLQRRGIQLILKYLYKSIPSNLATIHIDQLLSLLKTKHPSGILHFPKGLIVTKSYHQCTLAIGEETEKHYLPLELQVPGEVFITDDVSIKAEWVKDIPKTMSGVDYFICTSDHIALPIHIRTRKTGDRMTLKGMVGTKKLKDIFIDEKIPREKRDRWPVVVDGNGEILWLPLLKKSRFFFDQRESTSNNSHVYLLLQYILYNKEL
ncbi:tRNA lysidine(34) synthetase TilS [Calidifontibacillus erzurumensis]|uniref:tRNA(Ile)-lysidine synthase n=1 Tax=Calidifontibacillus erzurumensis TaxID=2741433 RepID=A0A8J8GIC5_9BACI|nr:tRNA lysidine(34) synthetase TilS [Calidifontibacillus erzurumensis]NSL52908.1 tRNA lysidine(34) synthetase TilS [Calidifontibacillus erzurumensis]